MRDSIDSSDFSDGLTRAATNELLDQTSWREPLEGYARATKLAVMMVDPNGARLGPCINAQQVWQCVTAHAGDTRPCPFCLHPEPGCQALAEARQTGQVAFARDRTGIAHITVPIVITGRVIAFIHAGQVFDMFPEQLLVEHLARATRCPPQALWDIARRQVPVGRQLLQAYGELLFTLAESFVRATYAGIVDRQRYGEILGLHAHLAERQQIESALRDADRRKDEFLATLAHELRNPLAPMMTAVHLLQHADENGGTGERALATLQRQLRHMVRLVDDLLDFSRITRGHIDLQRRYVPLSEIIASAVETSRPEIDQRQHALSVDDSHSPVMLNVDPVRISQALSNLLTNAARYMEPGGQIRLSVCGDDDAVTLCVADKGMGLGPELIEHVFDMFVRGSSSRHAAPGGLGIGLTLARMVVEMHGGTIAVRSDGPGNGSEFTIRLPVAKIGPEDVGAHDDEFVPPGSLRILVVEDNEDSREMLTRALEFKGHDVRGAEDGPSAIDAALAWRPDVVILDIGLPGMSGHDVARRLRQRPELKDVVLVALTGWGQEQDRRRSSEAGIAHHLTKPVDPDGLNRLLGALTRH